MNLLILLNGHIDKLFKAHKLSKDEYDIVKFDEKSLASPRKILEILKTKKYARVYFGCMEIEFLRFKFFIFLYFFLAGIKESGIVDELGSKLVFSKARFLFVDFPKIIIETILSFFVVIYFYIKLPFLKLFLKSRI